MKTKTIASLPLFCLIMATFLLLPPSLRAQSTTTFLGGQTTYNGKYLLNIRFSSQGHLVVYKNIAANGVLYERQMISNRHLFAIRIGNTVYLSYLSSATTQAFTYTDISQSLGGVVETVTKRYSAVYSGYSFYIDVTVRYDWNDLERITLKADIHADNIPAGTDISFIYYFLPYFVTYGKYNMVSAFTSPNIMDTDGTYLNGSNRSKILTHAEVQSLAYSGAAYFPTNSVLLFFPIGRPFDRAAAEDATSESTYFTGNDAVNLFDYFISQLKDINVAYDNIPAGETTTIETGLFISNILPGELDYTWHNSSTGEYVKHLTVPMNTPVNFRMAVNNYNNKELDDIGFRFDMPAGLPVSGTPVHTGFTSATHTNGVTYYQVAGGIIPALGSGIVLAPVSTAMYGQWTVTGNVPGSLSNNILPPTNILPAILTVTTEVNYLSTAPAYVLPGGSHTYTVKLPDGVTADRDIAVNLSYSGATSAFSAPATATIPNGQNSATFTVGANPAAADGSTMTVTLSGTSYAPVLVGSDRQATIKVVLNPPALSQPANQILCTGTQTAPVNFAGTNIDPAQCTWTAINGAAIGLADSGTGNIPAFTALARGRTQTATFTVSYPGAEAKEFTITVSPCVVPVNPHLRSRAY